MEALSSRPAPSLDQPTLQQRLLLIADDDPAGRTADGLLADTGFTVERLADAACALREAAALHPAAVLVRLDRDPADTVALLKALRQHEAATHAPHQLVLGIGGFAADRARALAAGLDDVLETPLRVDQLLAVLARHSAR